MPVELRTRAGRRTAPLADVAPVVQESAHDPRHDERPLTLGMVVRALEQSKTWVANPDSVPDHPLKQIVVVDCEQFIEALTREAEADGQ